MDHCRETIQLLHEPIVDLPVIFSAADGADTIHELDAVRRMTQNRAVIAKMTGSKQGRKLEIQINESENAALAQEKCAQEHLSVAASSDYDDRQFRCNHWSVREGGSSLGPGRHRYLKLAFDQAHHLICRDGFRCRVASRPG